EELVTKYKLLNDEDANTRLAAIVSLIEIAPSESLGATLYQISTEESIKNDEWLSKAVYAVANQHRKGFLTAFKASNADYTGPKVEVSSTPESPDYNDSAWKPYELPKLLDQNADG
ncbi:MAG TPA: hypothetical protein PLJ08_23260, partial [Cyclobacteriaceae bacterium]|nr:hypothetical protein [Cyclobacteriaceae bacterium]